jgi:hypothetical protein
MQKLPIIRGLRGRISNDDAYEKLFDEAYSKLKKNENYENKIPFVFLGIAYLEYCMNLAMIDFFNNEFPEEYSTNLAKYYLRTLRIKEKLKALPGILSNKKVEIDNQSVIYQNVLLLIDIRNTITHRADFYETIDALQSQDGSASATFVLGDDLYKISHTIIDNVFLGVKTYVNEVCKKYSMTKSIVDCSFIKKIH